MTELSARGHTFRTRSDTEVIVHAWEEWGEACVERFRGMFAFGLWDRNRETLFLARDRLGVKPMYYTILRDGMLLFGSELKALLAYPGIPRAIEPQTVEEYFRARLRAGAAHGLQGHLQAAARARARDPSRPADPRNARILGRALRRRGHHADRHRGLR